MWIGQIGNIDMIKLYLDVDGVLLTTKNTQAAEGGIAFIENILSNFDCYWLTTHCRDNNTDNVLRALSKYYPSNIIEKLKKVKPTKWDTLKTEGIDFNSKFYWLDDYIFEIEKDVLKQHGCLDNLILVNLANKEELFTISSFLVSL